MSERRRGAGGTQTAFVLHAYDWSESSLILDLFTRAEGRQVAAAKGAKRPYSQLRAVLLPFQCVELQLSRARPEAGDDDVRTLRSAEWAPGCPVLAPAHLLSAYYLNELLMKFLPRGEPNAALFDGYAQTLAAMGMQAGASQAAPALRAFELLLLHQTGLLPDLAQEAPGGQPLHPQVAYALRPELGLVRSGDAAESLTGEQWVGLQAALDSGHLPALQAACAASNTSPRAVLRLALRRLLSHHLDGVPLRTREMVQSLQRLGAVSPDLSATPSS